MENNTILGSDKLVHQIDESSSVEITFTRLKDNQTDQYVYYCQELEVSGYGETESMALEMLKFNVDQAFKVPL